MNVVAGLVHALGWLGTPAVAAPQDLADLAITADRVLPVAGPAIPDGVVLVRDGKITAVGPRAAVPVPDGARVVHGAVVTPGIVDGLTTIGLSGPLNKPVDQDHREPAISVAPELRALDAFAPWDELVTWVRQHGVTTVNAGPSPGAPVGGRTVIASTWAAPGGAPTYVVPDGMIVLTLGEATKTWPNAQSRMGAAAEIRQAFAEAREYRARRALPLADRPVIDLGSEALAEALDGKRRVVIIARRADDILTALRLRDEFGLNLVLAGASEAYLVRDAIVAAKVPVLVGPVMDRTWSTPGEARDGTFENAHLLDEVGVQVGFMTGYESYVPKVRVALFEAAVAAANGLGPERALELATRGTAEILGIADRKGTLAVGRDADVVVFDGDPFEVVSHVCAVVIGGAVVDEGCR